jgi:hypothetical protein
MIVELFAGIGFRYQQRNYITYDNLVVIGNYHNYPYYAPVGSFSVIQRYPALVLGLNLGLSFSPRK